MKRYLPFSDWGLRGKFFSIFAVLIILPVLGSSMYLYDQANDTVQMQTITTTEGHLNKIEENLSSVLRDIEDISSYMIYSEDIRSLLMIPKTNENFTALKEIEKRVNGFSIFHLNSKFYMESITLSGMNGTVTHIGPELNEKNEGEWEGIAYDLRGEFTWSHAYRVTDYWNRENKVIGLYRVINDINDVNRPIGRVTFRLDATKLYELIQTEVLDGVGEVFVTNQAGTVILHSDSSIVSELYPDEDFIKELVKTTDQGKGKTFNYRKSENEYLVVTRPLAGTDWLLTAKVDKEKISAGLTGLKDSIVLMVMISTVLGVLAMYGFYHFYIKRILDLTRKTTQVENGDFSAKVPDQSRDELGLLGMRFNRMVGKLQHLIDNEYKMEIQNRESELKLLVSQINPHFLYNTLDMIRWSARLEKAIETSQLIEMLSQMFRISLSRGKVWIPLKDELTYNRNYLQLQKKRLGRKLEFTLYCDHDALKAIVLKQSIQPLIENSIQHGFSGKRKNGKLYIRMYRLENSLIIDVIDNGKGLSEEGFNSYIQSGFALKNIKDRLEIAFGPSASIHAIKKESEGVWIRLELPFIENEAELKSYRKPDK